jgi:hypothetical protein
MAKAPKKPKASAPLSTWEKYDKRHREYVAAQRKKEALVKKHRG